MTALQKIITRAKQLRKASPSLTWKAAVKKASAEYRASGAGNGATKKKTVTKKVKRSKSSAPRSGSSVPRTGTRAIDKASAASLLSLLKKRVTEKIDKAVVRKYHATTKKAKRDLQKAINAGKAQLRKLS